MVFEYKNHRTLLSFDFGKKRIGVAVGQTLTSTSSPVDTVKAVDGKPDWEAISLLIAKWAPDALVVGLPLNMDGTEHDMSQAARRFSNQLHGRFNLPVYLVDERLTSVNATAILNENASRKKHRRKKGNIDKIAAQLILETWFSQQ